MSGLSRRSREGYLAADQVSRIRQLLMVHITLEYQEIALNDADINRAIDLLAITPLRAFDALQLASAVEVNQRMPATLGPMIFVSADRHLLQSAVDQGLTTVDPNSIP